MVDKIAPGQILDMDATALAAKIAGRELTSLEVTEAFIAHLQRIQPQLNCLVEDRFEESRAEARKADQDLANGLAKGRLFGVPISIKESFHVAGMRTTSGLPHRRDLVEEQDAKSWPGSKARAPLYWENPTLPSSAFARKPTTNCTAAATIPGIRLVPPVAPAVEKGL